MSLTAYLNGEYAPISELKISVLDRGFLFADAVYETIPVYQGRMYRAAEHFSRLSRSLQAIQLSEAIAPERWLEVCQELINRHYHNQDLSLYLQVTRGSSDKRGHTFPDKIEPSLFVMLSELGYQNREYLEFGVSAITMPDLRWSRCDIKSTNLLANVLAHQQAHSSGCQEAILIHDGHVTEGSCSNLFIISDGVMVTPPEGQHVLGGITRVQLLELAEKHKLPYVQREIPIAELQKAQEIWITSSSREIWPVVELDQQPVANGKPGPLWSQMLDWYRQQRRTIYE